MTYAENDYSQQQDNGGNENVTPDDIKAFLQENLSPEAFQRVEEMLTALMMQDQESQDPDNQEPDENSDPDFVAPGKAGFIGEFGNDPQGEDQPPAFRGKPGPGGAQDSAYYRRFPDARRLKNVTIAQDHRPAASSTTSSAAYASYVARFGKTRVI